jgi:hypothetical protein
MNVESFTPDDAIHFGYASLDDMKSRLTALFVDQELEASRTSNRIHFVDIEPADKAKMNGFILSNIASTAGIWSGQQKSIFELSNQFSDLSPVQNQVRVMRTFVRGILSEGLAVEVAVGAPKAAYILFL